MADFTFTQSDTRPFFAVIIKNTLTNEVVDLTSATVTFYFENELAKAGDAKVSAGSVTVTDATAGECEYRWGATDLDVPGIYNAEFRVLHSDGNPQRVRIEGVEVLRKLGS